MAKAREVNKQPVVDELRELRNWIAVFEEEYDLDEEVVQKLRERIDNVAEQLEIL